MRGLLLTGISALLLAGCGNAPARPPIDAQLRARALASIRDTIAAPNAMEAQEVWQGRNDIVCGTLTPPARLRDNRSSLRFYYSDRVRHGQVEFHELLVANTVAGSSLIAQNRREFDRLWQTSCAPTGTS